MIIVQNISDDSVTVSMFGDNHVQLAPGEETVTPADRGVQFVIEGEQVSRFDPAVNEAITTQSFDTGNDWSAAQQAVKGLPLKAQVIDDLLRRMRREVYAHLAEEKGDFFLHHHTNPFYQNCPIDVSHIQGLEEVLTEDLYKEILRGIAEAHGVFIKGARRAFNC